MTRKQSLEDQIRRLDNGTCPVHGLGFGQIATSLSDSRFTVGECPRKDCEILAVFEANPDGAIRHLLTREQLGEIEEIWADMFAEFLKEADKKIELELEKIAGGGWPTPLDPRKQ